MLIYVSESLGSGAELLVRALETKYQFERIPTATTIDQEQINYILEYGTTNYTKNLVFQGVIGLEQLQMLEKRPFFMHITIEAALRVRLQEWCDSYNNGQADLEKFLQHSETTLELNPNLPIVCGRADVRIYVRTHEKLKLDVLARELDHHLRSACQGRDVMVPFNNTTPLRPDWDTYFMKLATLAASRSNCMKRRVGCVIVRDCRVIATGYNGTPRHLKNCHSGGCPRCNSGEHSQLSSCLCLHAEENALLEAGRDRIGPNAILYCDTCPCLTCSVKIVQTGIREVVYSQSYRMDEASFKILQEGGVLVRQFSFKEDPHYSVL
ncbi:LAME_0F17018g1_1 [Lachancea meyersii CBS 8951]|uniref:Deoxycytidylate deaminase n=1 Tax=Lachancea meyersii CBS 8951 TaxID=1266667 RepID=A0A1G4JZJ2_9SACH|nr:LAME_0F17018g1_1 [Lachancea meyersii CBS 8951]